jgi:DNA-binding PadR family transcriptional regulator
MPAGTVSFRYLILGLLAQQSMSGCDIKRFLRSANWLIASPSFGSVYPALHALPNDGLASVEVASRESKPPQKIYSITAVDRQVLEERIDVPATTSSVPLKAFTMRLVLASNSRTLD